MRGWLYNGLSQAKLIGSFDETDNKGHLVLQGQLPKGVDTASYKDLVITREKPSTNPTSPGTIYLRGSIQHAAGGASWVGGMRRFVIAQCGSLPRTLCSTAQRDRLATSDRPA